MGGFPHRRERMILRRAPARKLARRRSRYHRLVKRALAWFAGLVGIAALGRWLAQRRHPGRDRRPSRPQATPPPTRPRSYGASSPTQREPEPERRARPSGGNPRGAARPRPREGPRGDRRDGRRRGRNVTATEQTAHGREPEAELTQVVLELSDRIEALQADVRRLGGPGLPSAEPGWSGEDAASGGGPVLRLGQLARGPGSAPTGRAARAARGALPGRGRGSGRACGAGCACDRRA